MDDKEGAPKPPDDEYTPPPFTPPSREDNSSLIKGDLNLFNKLTNEEPVGNVSEESIWKSQAKLDHQISKPDGLKIPEIPTRDEKHDTIIDPEEHN